MSDTFDTNEHDPDRLMVLLSELIARRQYAVVVACLRFWHTFRGLEDYMERQEDEPENYLIYLLTHTPATHKDYLKQVVQGLSEAPVFYMRVRAHNGNRDYWNPTEESFSEFQKRHLRITVAEDWAPFPAPEAIHAWLSRSMADRA